MYAKQQKEWVILSITLDGDVFSYPEWADRLCGSLSHKSDNKSLSYSDYLHPMLIDGLPAVVMDAELEFADLDAFKYVNQFASENRLKVRSGRTPEQLVATSKHRVLNVERRDLCSRRGS